MTTGPGAPLIAAPHRRYNPLTEEWVLVSAGRTQRPWLGRKESTRQDGLPAYDPSCYLCPSNLRANGDRNPDYNSTYVFTNDFAALRPNPVPAAIHAGVNVAETEVGTCRVLCFSPRHDLTLGRMEAAEVRGVVDMWAAQSAELGEAYRWIQVFENRGSAMGASNPHPHGQIWAGDALPNQGAREEAGQRRHFEQARQSLLLEAAAQESGGPREIERDDEWLIVVPFWAAWPFETMLIPLRPVASLPALDGRQRDALAVRLIGLLGRYDALFGIPFPYSMGWHQAPFDGTQRPWWQLHAHFYPPLLQASVRKFMVGYELLSEPQRDITPEDAALRLRQAGGSSTAGEARVGRENRNGDDSPRPRRGGATVARDNSTKPAPEAGEDRS